MLESHVKLCLTEPEFFGKFFLLSKLGKWAQTGFFEFIGKYSHQFLLNLVYNENLYYLLCSCTNPIRRKIFVPEIWTKMFSVNQVAGIFNQPYLQNKSMKQPDFLHVDTNSLKLKVDQIFFGWEWSSGHRTLKLTVSQECTDEVNSFLRI